MLDEEVSGALLGYIRDAFLAGDAQRELDLDTPLLEWGVLTSLNTAALLQFIRSEIGVEIPAVRINGRNFRNVRSITAMILELAVVANAAGERRAEGQA